MTLEYVVDPDRFVGAVVMVAPDHPKRPERRDLDAFTQQLVEAMNTRSVPFITDQERARLLERYYAEIEGRHEEASDV